MKVKPGALLLMIALGSSCKSESHPSLVLHLAPEQEAAWKRACGDRLETLHRRPGDGPAAGFVVKDPTKSRSHVKLRCDLNRPVSRDAPYAQTVRLGIVYDEQTRAVEQFEIHVDGFLPNDMDDNRKKTTTSFDEYYNSLLGPLLGSQLGDALRHEVDEDGCLAGADPVVCGHISISTASDGLTSVHVGATLDRRGP